MERGLCQKLLSRHARLSLLLQQLSSVLFGGQAKLCGLPRQLALKLCGRKTKLACKLLRALSKLSRLRQVLRGKLLCGQALLSRRRLRRQSQLTHLVGLCGSQLFGRKTVLGGQFLRRQPSLCRQLFGGQPELTKLARLSRRQLFRGKTQLSGSLCRLNTRLRTLRAQRTCKLCCLLRSTLLRFKRLERPLLRAFIARLTHLRRGSSLLLQHVPSQFRFGNRLSGSTKSPLPNGLRGKLLLLQLARTGEIRERLLDRRALVLVHV